jgi:hypothetical protein
MWINVNALVYYKSFLVVYHNLLVLYLLYEGQLIFLVVFRATVQSVQDLIILSLAQIGPAGRLL